jgi:hypothetical protein
MDDQTYNPDTDKLIEYIEERKQLNLEVDKLRVEALRLAIDPDILEEYSELKPWYADARRAKIPLPARLHAPRHRFSTLGHPAFIRAYRQAYAHHHPLGLAARATQTKKPALQLVF